VYPVVLLLEYEDPPGQRVEQCAYLLVSLGETPEPALHLEVPRLDLSVQGTLGVLLRSADGQPHSARLRVHAPPSLRVLEIPDTVQVPGSGDVVVPTRLMRATGVRDSDIGIVVLASASEGDVETTVATPAVVHVRPALGWLPRWRGVILAVSGLLILAALAVEVRRRFRPATT